MKINPKNLNLTPDVAAELQKNYLTNVYFKDYCLDFVKYNRPISQHFFDLLKDTLEDEETDDDEKWEREYRGRDSEGWECVEYRAYKGPKPAYGEPNSLHLKIVVKFKPRPTTYRGMGLVGGILNGITNLFCAVMAIFTVDMLFPPKEGESTFGRDFLVGWGVLELLDAEDRNKELEERVNILEKNR